MSAGSWHQRYESERLASVTRHVAAEALVRCVNGRELALLMCSPYSRLVGARLSAQRGFIEVRRRAADRHLPNNVRRGLAALG